MHGDIYATKGTEYLLVIAYLLVLVATVKLLLPRLARRREVRAPRRPGRGAAWFALAEGYHYHPGHTWALEEGGDVVVVGLDDFAAKVVGTPDGVELPPLGTTVRQGQCAWKLRAGARDLAMLAPVDGRVVAVNDAVRHAPHLAVDDPYGRGWLLKLQSRHRGASLRNLLSGELASAWMRHTVDRLRELPAGPLGVVMADGGAPKTGFGRELDPEAWDVVAREFFRAE